MDGAEILVVFDQLGRQVAQLTSENEQLKTQVTQLTEALSTPAPMPAPPA